MIWGCFVVCEEDKSKACNEAVSRDGTNPKHYNTGNLCKYLISHEKEYKEFCEKKDYKLRLQSTKAVSIQLLTYHVAE